MPSSRGKKQVSSIRRQRKGKEKKTKQQTNKEGLSAKWGGPLGHLTWPLNPPKQPPPQKKQKQKK